jgi:chromosome segregation ATPase
MRTEDQIKRKRNELASQLKSAEADLANLMLSNPESEGKIDRLRSKAEQLESMVMMLEWVLNEPSGAYHT